MPRDRSALRPLARCWTALAFAGVVAAFGAASAGFGQPAQPADQLERGRYLVTLGDCEGCHTRPGGERFAGGLPLKSPFGTIYTANITPDPETGIGSWSDADFYRALHEGIDARGAHLYPAFPYPYFTRMS